MLKKLMLIMVFSNYLYNLSGGVHFKINENNVRSGNAKISDFKIVDINRISGFFRNQGEFYSNHLNTGPGFEWPKGSGIYAIFSTALWIGAKVSTDTGVEVHVATAGHFGSEFKPGRILSSGIAEDHTLPHVRIYQVKPLSDLPTTNPDYMQWPVEYGAPWIDVDNDNVWNPFFDRIGIAFAKDTIYPDLVQFCVFNDADSQYHNWYWGRSKPLGVEVRQTVWAFKNLFPDVHFIRFQIYNKSNHTLDSTFFTLWSDPDLGNAFDDNVGCDTTYGVFDIRHNLGYCYNGDNDDQPNGYGINPPAVGFKLLQGPIVPSENDTAYAFGKIFLSYKNLDLSSFIITCSPGQGGCTNPAWFDPSLYHQSYNIMMGLDRIGTQWIDPLTGDSTHFIFAGDPVSGMGFIQSNILASGDMRIFMSTGPVTLAPNDSQDIVYAAMISRGIDNINSIIKLRKLSNRLHYFIHKPEYIPYVSILNQTPYSIPFLLRVRVGDATNITALVTNKRGEILAYEELFNDGLHDDSLSNDNIWAKWIYPVVDSTAAIISLYITYEDGRQETWDDIATNITLMGRLTADSLVVVSDNINKDLLPNPGENIRFKILITNHTNFTVTNLNVSIAASLDSSASVSRNDIFKESYILPGSSKQIPAEGYFLIDISPAAIPGNEIKLVFSLYDENENLWYDTLKFPVYGFTYNPIDTNVNHISGSSEGLFKVSLVDYSQLKDNIYEISLKKVPDLRFNLVNMTSGDTLLKFYELPDFEGHNSPVIDGFRILRGNIHTNTGIKTVNYLPIENKWFTKSDKYKVDVSDYGVSYPKVNNFINKNSALSVEDLRVIEVRFSNLNVQKAYRYLSGFATFPPTFRYVKHPEFRPFVIDSNGTGFIYQDYELHPLGNPAFGWTVPFTVWEVDVRSGSERQLNIAIVENNDSLYRIVNGEYQYIGRGNIDGKWLPTIASNGGEELLIIFASTYSDQADTFYTKRNLKLNFEEFDVYYVFSPKLIDSSSIFIEGDIMRIVPYFPLTEKDKFSFNPLKLLDVENRTLLVNEYKLFNCYPNPFNLSINIKLQIPEKGKLSLDIYDILGRKVRTLFENQIEPGTYDLSWDGRDDWGKVMPSGVYFIRMRVNQFLGVKKTILLK